MNGASKVVFTTTVFHRLFEACHSHVSPNNFFLGCQYDSCHMSNPAVVCTSLQSYARACSELGVCIHWRNYTNLCSKLNLISHCFFRFSKTTNSFFFVRLWV